MRTFTIALLSSVLALAGCNKDEPAKGTSASASAAAAPSAKPASSAVASASASAAAPAPSASAAEAPADNAPAPSGPYAQGDALKYMPSMACAGRVYIDVAKLTKNPALAPSVATLDEKIAQAVEGEQGKKLEKALAALKAAGIQPLKDAKDLAVCIDQHEEAGAIVIGGDFAGKDVISALAKIAADQKEAGIEKKTEGGITYLAAHEAAIAQIAPNVIAVTRDKSRLVEMKKGNAATTDWPISGKLMFAHVDNRESTVDTDVTEKGDGVDVKATMAMKGDSVEQMQKNPQLAQRMLKATYEEVAKRLEKTPFKSLAPDLRAIKVEIEKEHVVLSGHVSSAHVADALKAFSAMPEHELEKGFGMEKTEKTEVSGPVGIKKTGPAPMPPVKAP